VIRGKLNRMKTYIYLLFVLVTVRNVSAQSLAFTEANWNIEAENHAFYTLKGRQTLHIFNGIASPKVPLDFKRGIIEYDVYITPDRGFPGMRFRMKDQNNFEEFYIRPHQSGNPDAMQYTPVYNGYAGWQLYVGEGYSTTKVYSMNDWNHVKIVIAENEAEVFINDMNAPVLYMPHLKEEVVSGSIQLSGGGPVGARYSNLKITKATEPKLVSKSKVTNPLPAEYVKSWQVSDLKKESDFQTLYKVTNAFKKELEWKKISVESRGFANLNRRAGQIEDQNTLIARLIIESDKDQVKKLKYGFSDRALVYLNDKIIAGGEDGFRSRDYRFLGTMGLFDSVFLHLEKGKNELWIVVSENFGGWGVMAAFENLEGIELLYDQE